MIFLEENFKWHLEAFASELFIYIITLHTYTHRLTTYVSCPKAHQHKLNWISLQSYPITLIQD